MPQNIPYERKNIVVAGGAGFIGSHLCDELVKSSNVICVDNFLTGSEENINHLLADPYFKFIRQDITEPFALDALAELKGFRISFQGIQEVYNLACPTSPKQYHDHRVETILANGLGTKNMLDLAVRHQARFLLASSSAVYGEPLEEHPFPESYWGFVDPIGARSSYAEGKRYAESLVVNYRVRFQLEAKIIRIFNTYGPRMRLADGRMLPDFAAAALENADLAIYGDPSWQGSYNYISDLIEALLKMMNSSETGPINIGNPEPHTMREIAERVIKLTGSQSRIVTRDPLPFTAKQGLPDIALAKERLGWFPVVPLEKGLEQTIEFMKGSRVMRLEKLPTGL